MDALAWEVIGSLAGFADAIATIVIGVIPQVRGRKQVLLSLDAVRAGDGTGVCSAVMNLVSVLSADGVPRALLYAAGQAGTLAEQDHTGALSPEAVDEALGRLAGSSLLTFSMNGETVAAHQPVMRVIRERLASQGHLTATCLGAATALEAWALSLRDAWQDRPGRRGFVDQIMALAGHSASPPRGQTKYAGKRQWAGQRPKMRSMTAAFLAEPARKYRSAVSMEEVCRSGA
jgi:hypothetical protein